MDDIFNLQIIRALQKAGYESFNKRALYIFKNVIKSRILSQMSFLSSIASHSQKSNVTLLDVLKFVKLSNCKINPNALISFGNIILENEEDQEEGAFINPIASAIEKYIHIYDYMPDFPPTHTFKKTVVKESKKENKAVKLKKQLEQSITAEKNLIKMLKITGKLPKCINFMNIRKY